MKFIQAAMQDSCKANKKFEIENNSLNSLEEELKEQ
jgi:hypothetical protein